MKKVKKLKAGSNIAIISPSNGLPNLFPGIYEMGLKNLEEIFGFNIIEFPSSRMSIDDLYKNPKLRADDINKAFEDKNIDGIICSIGGYESVRILKYLNEETIINNPKFIMGFSDSTTFLTYLNNLGLITFYGPSIMAGIAQIHSLPLEYKKHLEDIFIKDAYPYKFIPYREWTEGYKNWSDISTLGECTEFFTNSLGYEFLFSKEETEGELWGGCIEVLEFLKGTKYWPAEDSWNDKILFLETSEDKPLPINVGFMLRNYGVQGILNKIKGLIIGRPKDYTDSEKVELKKIISNILEFEFNVTDIPVIMNMDFGHTDPKIILPIGGIVKIIPKNEEVILMESPFFNI